MARSRAIILDENGDLLLGENHDGLWSLPGGGIKPGENPLHALKRECLEETSMSVDILEYLWSLHDNYVFLCAPENGKTLSVVNDPCCEFNDLKWFNFENLPEMNPYSEDIVYKFLRTEILAFSDKVEAGHIDVLVDGQKIYELDDDAIWLTLPRLAQERAKGKKIKFRQVLDDGSIVDQTPEPMPVSGSLAVIKINGIVDDLLKKHIPEQKSRPSIEILPSAPYLAKTIWRKRDGAPASISIQVNSKVLENEKILRQVLAHEIIHFHLYEQYGDRVAKHGEHFNAYAEKINRAEGDNYIAKYADDTNFKFD